jgi:hypothetical protein
MQRRALRQVATTKSAEKLRGSFVTLYKRQLKLKNFLTLNQVRRRIVHLVRCIGVCCVIMLHVARRTLHAGCCVASRGRWRCGRS